MENTNQALSNPYTILNGRVLWFDGDSSYSVSSLGDQILSGSKTWMENYVIDLQDFSVQQFNKLNPDYKLVCKENVNIDENSKTWNIPKEYMELPVNEIIYTKLANELARNGFSGDDEKIRIDRVIQELALWEGANMFNLLKTLMYIVDTFVENEIIWGTGRGSSCCSYILYLIGLHDVDSVFYDLEITDFFRA